MSVRRRRSRNGKKVKGITFGFLAFQGFACMMLLGILMMSFTANLEFEKGVDYIPIEVEFTNCVTETYKDSNGDLRTRYDVIFTYEVDGVTYTGSIPNTSVNREIGAKETRYYNPNNPQKTSGYASKEEMLKESSNVIVIYIILQAIALVFLGVIISKKLKKRQEDMEFESQVRDDIERNRDLYEGISIPVDKQQAFEVLDPLRQKAYQAQRKVDQLERQMGDVIGGNAIVVLIYVVLRFFAKLRIQKAKEQLTEANATFYKEYRKLIAEPVLNELFENVTYRPTEGFSQSELMGYKLYKESLINVKSEDFIKGTYKGVGYCQADVKREHKHNESKEFDFNGRVSIYDFTKNLKGEILITTKNNSNIVKANLNKISMESVAFNSRFDLYTSNPHIAYYVLTPQFMEYMMNLNIRGEFVLRIAQNKIYMLRNRIDGIFEPNMKRPIDVTYEIGKSYIELKEILDFIDIMNLDRVADEANLRGEEGEFDFYEEVVKEPSSLHEVVPEEDSIFGGPQLEEPPMEVEEPLYAEPDYNKTSKSGLKLRM